MPDEFTESSSQSIFGRLGDAIKGVLFGLVLIPIAVVLLFWNEGRAVKTATSLKEGAAAVVSVSADSVAPANDKKLIHLSGEVTTSETLSDATFGVSANALRLSRSVEMFQWKEEEKSETRKKLGGGTETIKTYNYVKTWSNRLMPSAEFKHPENHANPAAMLATQATTLATHVTLGVFKIPASVIEKMRGDQALSLSQGDLEKLPPDLKAKAKLAGDNFYFGADPTTPAIGDQRVSFSVLRPGSFSILARQTGDTLEPYPTKAGREIERVESGVLSADVMFQHAKEENNLFTWALRGVGVILMWLGLALILRPLVTVADVIPLLGDIIGAGAGFAALMLSLIVSFIVIAIAWFAVRPILAFGLVAFAIAGFVFARRVGAGKSAA